jgi:hypothetical protein
LIVWGYYTCRETEYQQYFQKTKKIAKKHLLFSANFGIISKRFEKGVISVSHHADDRRCSEWRSVIIVARALPSVSRSPTPTDVPTEPGSPMLSGSRPLSTVLRAMCTLVPDASVPTRSSGLSDFPAINYGIATAMPFFVV